MKYFYEQILDGLTKVPTYGNPGTMIISNDKAQAVFTADTSGEVFLAAAQYGNGRLFVATHDCYVKWLMDTSEDDNEDVDEETLALRKQFINNVIKWLTNHDSVESVKIINVEDIDDEDLNAQECDIVAWCQDDQVDDEKQKLLLNYLNNGGSLFCGVTPWGFLFLNKTKKLSDLCAYRFLKHNFGIVLTDLSLNIDSEISIEKNQAKYASFDRALTKITANSTKLDKYGSTIESGLDVFRKEGSIDECTIEYIKNAINSFIENNNLNPFPQCNNQSVKNKDEKNVLKLYGKCLIENYTVKAPHIEYFPGDYTELPELLCDVNVSLETKFIERLSTGYYLPAGVQMNVKIIEGNMQDWYLRIGAHSDNLTSCEEFKRWPIITVTKNLENEFKFCSPFGGLIYFESTKEGKLEVILSNIVETPYLDVLKPETVIKWNKSRINAPGLWTELAGEHVIFTCPSESIRNLENPLDALKFWDDVVKCHHKLRGTDPYKYRRERVVNDKQPCAGYMHAGYPIVTHLDICEVNSKECMFDVDKLKVDGCWGLFHEFGHNMQRSEWTFDGSSEVTVNLFSIHAMEFIIGKKILKQTWILNQRKLFNKFFSKQPTYSDWKSNCYMGIMTFAQLIKHFGWQPMYKFMFDYENDIETRKNLPKTNQDKIDQWVIRYSKILNKNIKPQFELWGLPVSNDVDAILENIEKWCPRDELYPNPEDFYNEIE